jgi:hypothetical protein
MVNAMYTYLAGLALVGAAALWQTHQLALAEGREASLGRQLAELRQSLAEAEAEAQRRIASAQETVRREYEESITNTEPLVERVVVRIRDRCVPVQPAPAASGDAVPQPAGVADGAAQGVGDDQDDGFADALGRDITYCRAELARLTALQNFWRSVAR